MGVITRLQARLLYWSPRGLGLLFALFISIFALDAFGEVRGFWMTALALVMHVLPSLLLLLIVLFAWRWEWMGTLGFSLMAAIYCAWALPRHPSWAAIIGAPMFVIAALYLVCWIKRESINAAK